MSNWLKSSQQILVIEFLAELLYCDKPLRRPTVSEIGKMLRQEDNVENAGQW